MKSVTIPVVSQVAAWLAASTHPSHLVHLSAWGFVRLLPSCNLKYFGYRWLLGALALGLLSGCMVQPPSLVRQPTTAQPQPTPVGLSNNGTIFQVANHRPLFQDRIPSLVGDTLTVTIQEKSSTSSNQQVANTRQSALTNIINTGLQLPFVPNSIAKRLSSNAGATGSASHSGKGNNQVATSFISSITVTVLDVLSNGNLVVSGEKSVRINGDTESIRLSGVINPLDIGPNRTVSSLNMADVRVEQITQGNNRLFNEPGWLAKFFLSVLPI